MKSPHSTATVKRQPKPASYTSLQEEFLRTWRGRPVVTVVSVDQALTALASLCTSAT